MISICDNDNVEVKMYLPKNVHNIFLGLTNLTVLNIFTAEKKDVQCIPTGPDR